MDNENKKNTFYEILYEMDPKYIRITFFNNEWFVAYDKNYANIANYTEPPMYHGHHPNLDEAAYLCYQLVKRDYENSQFKGDTPVRWHTGRKFDNYVGYIRQEEYSGLIFYPDPPPLKNTDCDMSINELLKKYIDKKIKITITEV